MKKSNYSCHKILHERFNQGFQWNLWGSFIFEGLKVLHNALLINLMAPTAYGFVGTIFAMIFFGAKIADLGAAYSLAPFFTIFTKNKKAFKNIFLIRYLLATLPFIALCSAFITVIAYHHIKTDNTHLYLFIVPLLIMLETLRSIFRQFLHTAFKSKATILSELIIFFVYLGIIWIPYVALQTPLTPNLIFIPFCLDAVLALIFFTYEIKKVYITLPDEPFKPMPNIVQRMVKTRSFDYLLRVSREIFTSNMITPLFAFKFGLKHAGIFYFASTIARSVYSIIRSAIGHPGNAVLAQLKNGSRQEKKEVFESLAVKLMIIIAPIIIFLSFNYSHLITLSISRNPTQSTITFSLIYLLITFTELFFMLYEQFYILEEAAGSLFSFKLFELILFYGFVLASKTVLPVKLLLSIIAIRCLTFVIVAMNAYFRWNIRPTFKIGLKYLGGCISVSLIFTFLHSFM